MSRRAGICAAGTFVCQGGGEVCVQDQEPGIEGPFGDETCVDDLDNDCDLDIDEAVARVRYRSGDVLYQRECFSSHPDQVIVIRLAADKPGGCTGTLELACAHGSATSAEGGRLAFAGRTETGDASVAVLAGTFTSPVKGPVVFAVAAPRAGGSLQYWRRAQQRWILELMDQLGGAVELTELQGRLDAGLARAQVTGPQQRHPGALGVQADPQLSRFFMGPTGCRGAGVQIGAEGLDELHAEGILAGEHGSGQRVGLRLAVGIERSTLAGEQAHLFAELRPAAGTEALERRQREIVQAFHRRFGFRPGRVLLLAPHSIPRTANGKLQRGLLRQLLLDGELRRVGRTSTGT